MSRRSLGAVAVLFLVAVVAGGLVFAGGFSPGELLSGSSDESSVPEAGGATTADDAETLTRGADSRYDFAIEGIDNCGRTCREVTAELANRGSDPRENVRVTTMVYADGDLLWQGNETVGRLAGGETHTSTRRVDLGLGDALTIRSNDGYVTIVTVVRSADGTVRFAERREVA